MDFRRNKAKSMFYKYEKSLSSYCNKKIFEEKEKKEGREKEKRATMASYIDVYNPYGNYMFMIWWIDGRPKSGAADDVYGTSSFRFKPADTVNSWFFVSEFDSKVTPVRVPAESCYSYDKETGSVKRAKRKGSRDFATHVVNDAPDRTRGYMSCNEEKGNFGKRSKVVKVYVTEDKKVVFICSAHNNNKYSFLFKNSNSDGWTAFVSPYLASKNPFIRSTTAPRINYQGNGLFSIAYTEEKRNGNGECVFEFDSKTGECEDRTEQQVGMEGDKKGCFEIGPIYRRFVESGEDSGKITLSEEKYFSIGDKEEEDKNCTRLIEMSRRLNYIYGEDKDKDFKDILVDEFEKSAKQSFEEGKNKMKEIFSISSDDDDLTEELEGEGYVFAKEILERFNKSIEESDNFIDSFESLLEDDDLEEALGQRIGVKRKNEKSGVLACVERIKGIMQQIEGLNEATGKDNAKRSNNDRVELYYCFYSAMVLLAKLNYGISLVEMSIQSQGKGMGLTFHNFKRSEKALDSGGGRKKKEDSETAAEEDCSWAELRDDEELKTFLLR